MVDWLRATTVAGVALLASGGVAIAQTPTGPKKPPPTADSLGAITERGRLLAGYDGAAWIASDSIMARRPATGTLSGYVAQRTNGRWVVAFGRMNAGRDTSSRRTKQLQRKRIPIASTSPPSLHRVPTPATTFAQTRAIDSAKKDFGNRDRPYNTAVLERNDGSLYVYLMPAQVQDGVFPLGADARYHASRACPTTS